MLNIGCHLSVKDGYKKMGETIIQLGGNTFQFFTRNPRGGKAKKIDLEDIEKLKEIMNKNNFGKILAHAPYTMNLCSKDSKLREYAKEMMLDDIARMELIPNNYYNIHPGNHVKQGIEIGIELIAKNLNEVIKENQTTTVLLETMAGKGTEIGSSFEEIKSIIDKIEIKDKVGVCLDTCHVFDAGYDIAGNLDGILDEFDKIIGLNKLKAIHLNDTKNPIGSHKDRHEKIGLGSIGEDNILKIINNARLKGIPFFLETPNDLDGYKMEIEWLKNGYIK